MKKFFKNIKFLIPLLLLFASTAYAAINIVPNGGTGVSTIGSGRLIFGNGTSPIGTDANLTWDATTGLAVGKNIIGTQRYVKFGSATPNNTICSAGTSPCLEMWGTDNTTSGVVMGTGNTSNGTSAYNGLFFNNDLAVSNDFTHYGFIGLNSSTYNDTTFGTAIAVPNLMVMQNTDGPIAYAAVNNSGAHIFYIGNTMSGGFATIGTANEVARINITGLGIHTTNPLVGLEVAETNTNAVRGILTGQYSTGTSSSRILLRKARGSITSPSTIVTGDNLGALVFEGYDGSGYLQMGNIITQSEGTIGTNRIPTNIRFQTATDASPSVLTTALTLDSAQKATFAGAITNGTSGVLTTGTIELGAASDTTIARVSAGKISVEGVNVVTTSSTDSLTNKKLGSLTTNGLVQTSGSDGTLSVNTNVAIGSFGITIDGGGSAITTGLKGDLTVPFACTINSATMMADQSGSIVVDVWKDTYANYPPTVADTITASAKPTISSATKSQDNTLTGWTTSVSAGDTIRFNVDSVTTITRATLSIKCTKT